MEFHARFELNGLQSQNASQFSDFAGKILLSKTKFEINLKLNYFNLEKKNFPYLV